MGWREDYKYEDLSSILRTHAQIIRHGEAEIGRSLEVAGQPSWSI